MEFILRNSFVKASASTVRHAKRVVKKTVTRTKRIRSRSGKTTGILSRGFRLVTRATVGLGKLATLVLIGRL